MAWGIAEFAHRFGRKPEGMWLAETAVDYDTLAMMADMGITFTVLAPWQASGPMDANEPYWVRLHDGRRIAVFFFNGALSGAVSFDGKTTESAEVFGKQRIQEQVNPQKEADGQPQLILVATDGELYGHHKPWRDLFLKHLLNDFAPRAGIEVTALTRYLRLHPPRREMTIAENTSWSCHHGVDRWKDSCCCTEGDGSWKSHLRRAMGRLAARIDRIYEMQATRLLRDPWQTLEEYIAVKLGASNWQSFLSTRMLRGGNEPFANGEAALVLQLLEAQYYRQLMFTSCAFFFEDFDRIEPHNSIAMAARAITIVRDVTAIDLSGPFQKDLERCKSWRTGRTGVEIYLEVTAGRALRRGDALAPALPLGIPLLS